MMKQHDLRFVQWAVFVVIMIFSQLGWSGTVRYVGNNNEYNGKPLPVVNCPVLPTDPRQSTPHPIHIVTGNKFLQESIFQGGGEFPLSFSLYYNSATYGSNSNNDYVAGEWSHSYSQRITSSTFDPNLTELTMSRPDGRRIYFLNSTADPNTFNQRVRNSKETTADDWNPTTPQFMDGIVTKNPSTGEYVYFTLEFTEKYNSNGYLIEIQNNKGGGTHQISYNLPAITYPGQPANYGSISITHIQRSETISLTVVKYLESRYTTAEKSRIMITGMSTPSPGVRYYSFDIDYTQINATSTLGNFEYFTGLYTKITWPQRGTSLAEDTIFSYTAGSSAELVGNYATMWPTLVTRVERSNSDNVGYTEQNIAYEIRKNSQNKDPMVRAVSSSIGKSVLGTQDTADQQASMDWFDNTKNLGWDGKHNWVVRNKHGRVTKYYFTTHALNKRLQLVSVTGEALASGNCTQTDRHYTYDPVHNKVAEVRKLSTDVDPIATYSYDDNANLLTKEIMGDPEGITTYERNTIGQITKITKSGHSVTDITYSYGRVSSITQTDETPDPVGYTRTHSRTRQWVFAYTFYNADYNKLESVTVTDPMTNTTVYRYDTTGNLIQYENALNHITYYSNHDAHGMPRQVIDPNGGYSTLSYDYDGLVNQISVAGSTTNIKYNLDGQIRQVNFADGSLFNYEYSEAGRLTKVTNAQGEKLQLHRDFSADGSYELLTIEAIDTDFYKRMNLELTLDAVGRVWKQFGIGGAAGGAVTQESNYDDIGLLAKITDGKLNVVDFENDASGKLQTVNDRRETLVRTISTGYNQAGTLSSVADAGMATATEYIYDGFGNLLINNSPDAGTTTYKYDDNGNIVERTKDVTHTYTYDVLNRLTGKYYSTWLLVSYKYGTTENSIGRLSEVSKDSTLTNKWYYDKRGNIVKIEDIRSGTGDIYTTKYIYNNANKVKTIIYPSGRGVEYVRNNGEVNKIRVNGTQKDIVLSLRNEPYGPLRSLWFGDANVAVDYQYDDLYRPDTISANYSTNNYINMSYGYDANGNIETMSDIANGHAFNRTYTYKNNNRLFSDSDTISGVSNTYDYDLQGNRKLRNRTEYSITKIDEIFNYDYDTSGKLVSNRISSFDDGSNVFNYLYTTSGSIRYGARHIVEWDLFDEDISFFRDRASGDFQTYVHHNALGQRTMKFIPQVTDYRYVYGKNGELLHERDSFRPNWSRDYIYHEGRLVAFSEGSNDWNTADLVGTPGPVLYQHGDTLTINYDPVTPNAHYAYRNMSGISGGISAYIDLSGITLGSPTQDVTGSITMKAGLSSTDDYYKLSKKYNPSADLYQYWFSKQIGGSGESLLFSVQTGNIDQYPYLRLRRDDFGFVIAEGSSDKEYWNVLAVDLSAPFNTTPLYIGFSGTLEDGNDALVLSDIVLYGSVDDKSDLYFVLTDHLGTPQVITDEAGTVVWSAIYDAFGKATILTETIENNVRFPGQYYDAETGLHYNYFRYYDPETGRYISSDPIGLAGGLNTYAYVEGNPLRWVDPKGLEKMVFFQTGSDDEKYALNVAPDDPKKLIIFADGEFENGVGIIQDNRNGRNLPLDYIDLMLLINESGKLKEGMTIEIQACQAGKGENKSLASNLARVLKIKTRAPSKNIFWTDNGSYIIADPLIFEIPSPWSLGEMLNFDPTGDLVKPQ